MRSSEQKNVYIEGRAAPEHGVGARQIDPCAHPEGGRYQNVCTDSEVTLEPNPSLLFELRELDLPETWQVVAEQIGAESFLEVWRLLDELLPEDDRRINVPHWSRFERHQRNQYIRSLGASGHNASEIRNILKKEGQSLSYSSVCRILQD